MGRTLYVHGLLSVGFRRPTVDKRPANVREHQLVAVIRHKDVVFVGNEIGHGAAHKERYVFLFCIYKSVPVIIYEDVVFVRNELARALAECKQLVCHDSACAYINPVIGEKQLSKYFIIRGLHGK